MAFGLVAKMVNFLRAGLPLGAPSTGYSPALALFPRRATDEEIGRLRNELTRSNTHSMTSTDVGVALTRVLGALPSAQDIQRVTRRLVADDWTIS